MYTTYSSTAGDYTKETMKLMNHHWLMYIDHYFVGTSLTPEAEEYVLNHHRELRRRGKTNHVVTVTHNLITYEEFLQDPVFSIDAKMDPNTKNGFYHAMLNAIEFDSYRKKIELEKLYANPGGKLSEEYRYKLMMG